MTIRMQKELTCITYRNQCNSPQIRHEIPSVTWQRTCLQFGIDVRYIEMTMLIVQKTDAPLVFRQALIEARTRLRGVEVDFAALAAERDRLRAIVESLEAFSASGEQRALTSGQSELEDETKGDIPLWVHAHGVLSRHGTALTPGQIAEILQVSGVEVPNPNSLRVAMFRKPDVFRSDGNGRYGLATPAPKPAIDEEEEVEVAGPMHEETSDDYAQSAEISDDDIPF
jgi:hypothetical protein